MNEEKRAGGAFWCIVALTIPVAYVVSLGPSCWVSSRTGVGTSVVDVVYRPILLAADACPMPGWKAIQWYSKVGAPPDWFSTKAHYWTVIPPFFTPEAHASLEGSS
jgi:hypothetical protein